MSVRKKLNKEASEANFVVLGASQSGCCGEVATLCKYYFEAANEPLKAVTVSIDGENQTYTFGTLVDPNNIKAMRKAFVEVVKHFGYFIAPDDFMSITYDNGVLCVIGELEIVSVTYDPDIVSGVNKSCELGSVCKFVYNLEYDADPGILAASVDDAGEQIATTDGFPTATDISDIREAYALAFEDQLISLSQVWVTDNVGLGLYRVELHVQNTRDVYISGVKLQPTSCKQGFIIPAVVADEL